jgi:hypothetical protein
VSVFALFGAWGGILPFVDERFGYRPDHGVGWRWTESHATLSLAPGAAAVAVGLLLIAASPAAERLGLLGLIAGAWFVLGPTLEPLWTGGRALSASGSVGSKTMRALEAVGYHYGTGLVIAALAALSLVCCNPLRKRLSIPRLTIERSERG